jgi:hemolysin III
MTPALTPEGPLEIDGLTPPPPPKPLLRGVFHQCAAFVAFGAGLVLVAFCPTPTTRWASGVFASSLVWLFAVSATYHRIDWSEQARARMRRLDHASIFVLIAGTYTPVALLGLPESGGTLLLAVWLGALAGVLSSVFWVSAPKVLNAGLCVALGWTLLPYWGELKRTLDPAVLRLIVAGGIPYTLGALAYASKRPNPRPRVLGYHEIFHALTLVGAAFHFAAVIRLVRLALP